MDNLKAFVCGYPIKHSRSPMLHGFWLKEYNINSTYEKISIEPENFSKFLLELQQNGMAGGNVTLPHKEQAYRLVDSLDEAAEKIGAVNTLWFEEDKLIGGNTDAYGFTANLDQYCEGWCDNASKETAIVLGAGGASRAVLYSLVSRGYSKIYLANRTVANAEKLAKVFGDNIEAISLDDVGKYLSQASFLVNTTSLGMNVDDRFPFDIALMPKTALVTDIVYTPLETLLLKQAKNVGLKTVDGLGMLLHQAVPGFEKWFGVRPKVSDALRQLIYEDLIKDSK